MIGFSLEGESILMRIATLSTLGATPDGFSYHLSEGAFAGWVGLLVTAINLLPIGQLDGGHILYGSARRLQHTFAIAALVGLFFLGFLSTTWWVFAAMGFIFGVKHPPTLNDSIAPSRFATGMAIASLIIFGLSFTPIPFR
jgi:membrane-associated protease RseP (regulator of RpoE activity)